MYQCIVLLLFLISIRPIFASLDLYVDGRDAQQLLGELQDNFYLTLLIITKIIIIVFNDLLWLTILVYWTNVKPRDCFFLGISWQFTKCLTY